MSWPNIVIPGWSSPCGLSASRLGTIAASLALFVARMVVNALLTPSA
jgi:integral membrane sensor domain MASE1